jgi:hypothetical protein
MEARWVLSASLSSPEKCMNRIRQNKQSLEVPMSLALWMKKHRLKVKFANLRPSK